MFKQHAILLVALVALGASLPVEPFDLTMGVWSALDKQLKKATESLGIEENIKAAKEILHSKNELKPFFVRAEKFEKALKSLINMGSLLDGHKCDSSVYHLIEYLDRKSESGLWEFERLELIVRKMKREYAAACYENYFTLFKEREQQVAHHKDVQIVVKAFDKVINYLTFSEILPNQLYTTIISSHDYHRIWSKYTIRELWAPCKEMFPNVSNNKERFEKCILSPCQILDRDYYDIVEMSELFRMAPHYDEKRQDAIDFYSTWARYKLCWTFADINQKKLKEQLDFLDKIEEDPKYGCDLGYKHVDSANKCE